MDALCSIGKCCCQHRIRPEPLVSTRYPNSHILLLPFVGKASVLAKDVVYKRTDVSMNKRVLTRLQQSVATISGNVVQNFGGDHFVMIFCRNDFILERE